MNEEKFKKETNSESADDSKETNSESTDKSKSNSKEIQTDEASPAQVDNKNNPDNNEAEINEQLNAQELAAENANLKKEIALLKLNVKEEFKQDALLLAENLVNDGIEFSQALATVIGKYPQFVNSAVPKLNLGGPTQGFISRNNKDAFVSGIKNNFLGGW